MGTQLRAVLWAEQETITDLMHKDILTPIVRSDETPTFCYIEPLAAPFSLAQFVVQYCNGRPMGSCKHTISNRTHRKTAICVPVIKTHIM